MNLYLIFWKSLLWFILYFASRKVNNQVVARHASISSGNQWSNTAPEYRKKKSSEETTEINIFYDNYDMIAQKPRIRIKKHKEKEPEKKKKKKKKEAKHHVEQRETSKKVKVNAKKHKKKKSRLLTHHKEHNITTTRRTLIKRENITHFQKIKHKGSPVDITVHIKMNDEDD